MSGITRQSNQPSHRHRCDLFNSLILSLLLLALLVLLHLCLLPLLLQLLHFPASLEPSMHRLRGTFTGMPI